MLIALCVRVRGKSLKSSHMEPKYKRREPELQDNCARLKRLQQNAMKKKKKRQDKSMKHKAGYQSSVCSDCLYLVLVQE